jgi:hypothetical protein
VASASAVTSVAKPTASLRFATGSIQELIASTLDIPSHLSDRKTGDIRMAYARYLALLAAIATIHKMSVARQWTQRFQPMMMSFFMSKSSYFKNHDKVFPLVDRYPAMEKWLLNTDDAPNDVTVWNYAKPTFTNLKKILDACIEPVASHVVSRKKKKGKNIRRYSSSSPPLMGKKVVDRKGKGKDGGSINKAGSSKGHRM